MYFAKKISSVAAIVVLVALELTLSVNITIICPEGWSKVDAKCIRGFSSFPMPWFQAEFYCRSVGANLVKVDDYELNEAVQTTVDIWKYWTGLMTGPPGLHWMDDAFVDTEEGFWKQDQPNLLSGDCVYAELSNDGAAVLWSFENCDVWLSFVCETAACPAGTFRCSNQQCIREEFRCDGVDNCGDFSDEIGCAQDDNDFCTYYTQADDGVIQSANVGTGTYQICYWLIEAETLGGNVYLQQLAIVPSNWIASDEIFIFVGGRTEDTSILLEKLSGPQSSTPHEYTSHNNLMLIRYTTTRITDQLAFFASWTTIRPERDVNFDVEAGSVTTVSWPGDSLENYLGGHHFMCRITSTDPRMTLTLLKESVDLRGDDTMVVYDGTSITGPLLGRYTSTDGPDYIMSTSRDVLLYMKTTGPWTGTGVEFKVWQGCTIEITAKSGSIVSPGFGLTPYPNGVTCTWTITVPDSLQTTLIFDAFDLDNSDFLKIYTGSADTPIHTDNGFTGSTAPDHITYVDKLKLVFDSSPILNAPGFTATFSIDCPGIVMDPYLVITPLSGTASTAPQYRSQTAVSCTTGYRFASHWYGEFGVGGEFTSEMSELMECQLGGKWNQQVLPRCQPRYCGQPPSIENGFIASSTGVTFSRTATYECLTGFSLTSPAEVTCLATGQWSDSPACEGTTCSLSVVPDIENGGRVITQNGDFGSHATYSCDDGYDLIGEAILFCLSSGDWTGVAPSCTKLKCALPTILHGTLSRSSAAEFGDRVTVTCETPQYRLDGSSLLTCQANQEFDSIPECIDVDECTANTDDCSVVATCENLIGGFKCTCPPGYTPNEDGRSCNEINECGTDIGPCHIGCENSPPGSYTCTCPTGFVLFTSNGTEGYNIFARETGQRPGDLYHLDHTCIRAYGDFSDISNLALNN